MSKDKEPKVLVSEGTTQALRAAIETLDRAGVVQHFFSIRRCRPGEPSTVFWKRKVPTADIEDLEGFCFNSPDGSPEFDYKVSLVDDKMRALKSPDGKEIPEYWIRAIEASSVTPKPWAFPGSAPASDPMIQEKKQMLQRKKEELALKREAAALAREERRLQKKLEEDPDDENGDDDYYAGNHRNNRYHFGRPGENQYGYDSRGQLPMQPVGMGMTPWSGQRPGQPDPTMLILLEMIKSQGARSVDPTQQMMAMMQMLMPLIVGGKFDPADAFKMMGPMMASMATVSAEGQKLAMQGRAETDKMFMKKMLDMMEFGGADHDDLDRYRKIMGMVTDGIGSVAKVVMNRGAKPGDKVEVPRIGAKPPVGLPAPKPAATTDAGNTAVATAPEPPADPAAQAKEVVAQRVRVFLQSHEQEMLIGSDPSFIAEKLDELYLSLPSALRNKIEKLDVAGVYDALREVDAVTVDRILAAVAKDESGAMKIWATQFWDFVFHPETDEDGGDDDDGGDGDVEDGVPQGPASEVEGQK